MLLSLVVAFVILVLLMFAFKNFAFAMLLLGCSYVKLLVAVAVAGAVAGAGAGAGAGASDVVCDIVAALRSLLAAYSMGYKRQATTNCYGRTEGLQSRVSVLTIVFCKGGKQSWIFVRAK